MPYRHNAHRIKMLTQFLCAFLSTTLSSIGPWIIQMVFKINFAVHKTIPSCT